MESLLPFHWQRIYIQAGYRVGVGELMGSKENRPSIVGMDITLIYSGIRALFGPHPFSFPKELFSGTDMPQGLQYIKERLQDEKLISMFPPAPTPPSQITLQPGQFLLQIPV